MSEPVVIRGLAAAAAAAAVVGSILMRRWDLAAGKRVAELTAARVRDEWKTDERLAELETDLDETRLARTRLEAKLRGKRAELARLRTEHADLLRRYATAETERASALEDRRLESTRGKSGVPRAARALESAMQARAEREAGAEAYRKAAEALRGLERNAARQAAEAAVAVGAGAGTEERERTEGQAGPEGTGVQAELVVRPRGEVEAARQPGVEAGAKRAPEAGERPDAGAKPGAKPGVEDRPEAESGTGTEAGAAEVRPGTAVAPAGAPRGALPSGALARRPAPASRAQGGFDFFGTRKQPALPPRDAEARPAEPKPVEEQDLADVVGEETLAKASAEADGEVIDLTAHDDTEQIDVAELRSAI